MTRAPTKPTQLGLRLRLDETRPAAIASIADAFRRARTLPGAAEDLEVGERTLKRWIAEIPDVAAAIEAVRQEPPADEKVQLDRLDRLHRIQRCPRLARPHHAALARTIEAARVAAEDAIEALP